MADHNEIKFEQEISEHLAAHGWLYSPSDDGYDAERALFPADVFGWLADTQPDELAKVVKNGSVAEEGQVLDRLVKVLDTPLESGGGTLNVLRKGFQHVSARFDMAQFKPESTLNPATSQRYSQVRLRVMRQVHYSTATRHSLDLVLFVNGLPVATLELKTDFTQTVTDAINQYKKDRPVKDPATGKPQAMFGFGTRALVHFAVSNDEVWMTTRLAGEKTHFLPFNRGTLDGGAGNPPASGGKSTTAYLWEDVFERDAWLNILGRFLHLETRTSRDPISGAVEKSTTLLFPRYHQWDAVTRLTGAVTEEGPGRRYLIQHSAGSGKTNSIAWTAHRLARLQVDNQKVFDSVIVITDRNVLDAQLQEAIKQIDNDAGIVTAIDIDEARKQGATSKSGLLAKALVNGKLIIVVTMQTFPFAMQEIRQNSGLKDKRFAVIADEAHSSQTGRTATELKAVLTSEELESLEDGGEIDVEALLAAEATGRANSSNISYFAFTATPKAKTLELFGRVPEGSVDSRPVPFHVYSMKQAIEERFILDVLRGYHSFQLAFKVAGEAGAEREVDQAEATKRVKQWVKLNPQTIAQKSALIVEHFQENVAPLLEGHAKAMVVADSRVAAGRYKREIDKYVAAKGYDIGTLVAISGSISDAEYGIEDATEASLNPGVGDLRKAFQGDDRKVMIVANKFQTGFDQPLLSAMYVDRRLSGVTAVQTLSRLNRTYRTPSGQVKDTTSVVDFVNQPEDIQAAFEPYFTDAFLETSTDPNLVWDIAGKLDQARIYEEADLDAVVDAWVKGKGNQALDAAFAPALTRFTTRRNTAEAADDKGELDALAIFRKDLGTFARVYDFMSQIIDYGSAVLEKRSIFYRLFDKRLHERTDADDIDLSSLSLLAVRQVDKGKTDLDLGARIGLHGLTEAGSAEKKDPKLVALQEVIERLNDLFGAEEFAQSQSETFVRGLIDRMLENESLVQQARVNSIKQFSESPDFDEAVVDAVADNQGAHNKIADYFFTDAPGRSNLVRSLAKAFHELAADGDVA
ncbi:type I restriction endonuclease subunit R [Nocardioides terrisoli]|uniref:type I restriction endonuclease subunit R n=1 Tax=Nocardioides terrisoli TaxID=3388267 RepID=UPI00287B75B6|nr:type I restriction endonuclease [Nocardioides marmorisolisilvae]